MVLESGGNVTMYSISPWTYTLYTLVTFFRSKIGIKLMTLHVISLGWSISIAGTVVYSV